MFAAAMLITNVGRYDQVEAVWVETLFHWVFCDVQDFVFDRNVVLEPFSSRFEESWRDVGEGVR